MIVPKQTQKMDIFAAEGKVVIFDQGEEDVLLRKGKGGVSGWI